MPNVLPESLADKIIAEKIKEWQDNSNKSKNIQGDGIHRFVTITRDFGCHEEEIIPQLEETLGWKVYGKNLLNHIADREELSRNFLETLDETKQAKVEEWVNYIIHSGSILQEDYVLKISRLIKTIVLNENAIIIGRGANFILKNRPEGLRVKLTAPLESRVENIMKIKELSSKEAEVLVREKDLKREEFIKAYFKDDLSSRNSYDLAINTSTIETDLLCNTIKFIVKEKSLKTSS